MTITYQWKFFEPKVQSSAEFKTDVLISIGWTLTATDEDDHNVSFGGACDLPPPEPSTKIVPYNELTPKIVEQWVIDKIGSEQVNNLMAGLARDLAVYAAAPTKISALPWQDPEI